MAPNLQPVQEDWGCFVFWEQLTNRPWLVSSSGLCWFLAVANHFLAFDQTSTLKDVLHQLCQRHLIPNLKCIQNVIYFPPHCHGPLNLEENLGKLGIQHLSTLHLRFTLQEGSKAHDHRLSFNVVLPLLNVSVLDATPSSDKKNMPFRGKRPSPTTQSSASIGKRQKTFSNSLHQQKGESIVNSSSRGSSKGVKRKCSSC